MKNYSVFILSDGIGETAYRMLKATMQQFPHDILITRYANVREESQIVEIWEAAVRNQTLVLYTFVSSRLRCFLRELAKDNEVECVDLLGPLMDKLSSFFQSAPVAKPGLLHQVDEEYFARMDAIKYAIRHDDSQTIDDIDSADMVVVGVGRVGKTPLSIYLAQEGWKVANFGIVSDVELPSQLARIDQRKIVGLLVDPKRLTEIRRVQLQQEGDDDSSYADLDRIEEELAYARALYEKNPLWSVIDVTGKSIEEISQQVLDGLFGKGRRL